MTELFPGAESQAEVGFDAVESGGDLLAIGFRSVGVVGVPGFVLAGEAGKFFAQEGKELFGRRRHEEEHDGRDPLRAGISGGSGEGFQFAFPVGDAGKERRSRNSDGDAGIAQFADGGEPQIGARSARFHQTRQARTKRSDGDVHVEAGAFGDLLKEIDVAGDEIGFGDDGDAEAVVPNKFLKTGASDPVFLFGGLVRIGGSADADVFGNALAADGESVFAGDFAGE